LAILVSGRYAPVVVMPRVMVVTFGIFFWYIRVVLPRTGAKRGAETWGFHESPSYPHMYCFLVWMERKNGILYRKDSTLEHYCNR